MDWGEGGVGSEQMTGGGCDGRGDRCTARPRPGIGNLISMRMMLVVVTDEAGIQLSEFRRGDKTADRLQTINRCPTTQGRCRGGAPSAPNRARG